MMRGGHLDVCVLGAFQVSQTGDLANWSTGAPGAIPAVGGAMDLAIGAKSVYVMTDLLTKTGESKLVDACTYPLTGVGCVTRVYTDHAVFDVTPDGFAVREAFGDNTRRDARAAHRASRSRLGSRRTDMAATYIYDAVRTPFGRAGGALVERAPRRPRRRRRCGPPSSAPGSTRPASTT